MTVYLIEECGGSYEDTWSRIIKCFSDVKLAEEFVNSKRTLYNYHESFRETLIETYDLFNVLMTKYWFKKPIIDTNDYPMDKEANVFKNCVKETFPHLYNKYPEKVWDDIWEYYMREDDDVNHSYNKYSDSQLRYYVQPIQVENSL
jgi:hypothetical protein